MIESYSFPGFIRQTSQENRTAELNYEWWKRWIYLHNDTLINTQVPCNAIIHALNHDEANEVLISLQISLQHVFALYPAMVQSHATKGVVNNQS